MKRLCLTVVVAALIAVCGGCSNQEVSVGDEQQKLPVATAAERLAASVIELDSIEEQVVQNFKGGEGELAMRMIDNGVHRIMKVRMPPHSSVGYHTHATSSEVMYFLSGRGVVCFDSTSVCRLEAGDCHYCPKGHSHSVANDTDQELVCLAVVTEFGK